jgi:outer membrane protein assembly factor BamD
MKKLLWVAFLWVGCATAPETKTANTPPAQEAEATLKLGEEALKDRNFLEAGKYFEAVRSKFPYLEAAREAELRLADTDFEAERYIEARERYQSFVKLHPTHPKADYASYRAALCFYKEMPSDFLFIPPSYEKDQAAVTGTARAMGDFIRQYPNSPYIPEAKKHEDEARRRLAQHELYAADFYKRREKWAAVAGRLSVVIRDYSGLGYDERALFGLHEAYGQLKDPEKAKAALQLIIERMPGTDAAARAQKLLGSS